jgi:hypothetical protein
MTDGKISFKGIILSVQPRIKLIRSFDESSHNYAGYSLRVRGFINDAEQELSVGIGKAAQKKHQFCIGDEIEGECLPVADQRLESVEFYKATKLKKTGSNNTNTDPPPWKTIPPDLDIYRQRGHRRLSAQTYGKKCITCLWGCRMPVEIIIDNWNPSRRKYRLETFCYGPLSCELYKAGPTRKVEGRNGMIWEEEDWVDENATGHREFDE